MQVYRIAGGGGAGQPPRCMHVHGTACQAAVETGSYSFHLSPRGGSGSEPHPTRNRGTVVGGRASLGPIGTTVKLSCFHARKIM